MRRDIVRLKLHGLAEPGLRFIQPAEFAQQPPHLQVDARMARIDLRRRLKRRQRSAAITGEAGLACDFQLGIELALEQRIHGLKGVRRHNNQAYRTRLS